MVTVSTFRKLALSLPDATEAPHFEIRSFRLNKKIFATLDEPAERACLLLTPEDQFVFTSYDKNILYPVPNKWGLKGATYVDLKKVPKPMLKDALIHAYKKLIKPKKGDIR